MIAVGIAFALVRVLSGSTTTMTPDPNKAEVVTADVAHFWRAFGESAKVPTERRVDIYRREYFDLASQGLKDYAVFRRVTARTFAAHVEQNRSAYAAIRPCVNDVVKQKPMIQAAFRRLKALYLEMKFPANVYRGGTAERRRNEFRQRHHFGGGYVRHDAGYALQLH